MAATKHPWQRSFRRLPDHIKSQLESLNGAVRIAGSRVVPRAEILSGHLEPIGVRIEGDALVVSDGSTLPPTSSGIWARRNVAGWSRVRKDLPKVPRTYTSEVPNFGDWSKGSHEVDRTRLVYQREVVGPRNASIAAVCEGAAPQDDGFVIRFELEDLFDPADEDFERQILLGINILQESTGCASVFDANATPEDILAARLVDWVLFPPGISDKEYARIFARIPSMRPGAIALVLERRTYLESLAPRELVYGQALGATAYFGAIFDDDLVVFENMATGNAIYVMFEDWRELSQLSRTELLRDYSNYVRITHRGNWKAQVAATVARYR